MNKSCPVCGQDFEIETGFYWGSMYISYAITVLIFLVTFLFSYFVLGDPDVWVYLAILSGLLVVTSPLVFRYSRVLMLYWFGGVNSNHKID